MKIYFIGKSSDGLCPKLWAFLLYSFPPPLLLISFIWMRWWNSPSSGEHKISHPVEKDSCFGISAKTFACETEKNFFLPSLYLFSRLCKRFWSFIASWAIKFSHVSKEISCHKKKRNVPMRLPKAFLSFRWCSSLVLFFWSSSRFARSNQIQFIDAPYSILESWWKEQGIR